LKKEKKETDRKKRLNDEVKTLKEEEKTLAGKWQQQKEIIGKLQSERVKMDQLRLELERAEREALLDKAAEIKYGRIPETEKKLRELESNWQNIPDQDKLIRKEVTEEDVAKVVARWTGIPVTKLLSSETEKLVQLDKVLQKRVVGQDEALIKIARAIRRNRAGLSEEDRLIGSFLFLGPTGVGKTERAKALAEYLFDSEKALIRIDMSEYQEAHNIARLIFDHDLKSRQRHNPGIGR